jgi:uncharacterized protein
LKEEITALLALQDADHRSEELAAQVEVLRGERARLEAKLSREREAVEAAREALEALERESRSKNLSVDELDMKIRGYRTKLEKGIISFKEMESLRMKIAQEHDHMSALEDEALRLMDEIESSTVRLGEAREKLERREAKLTEETQSVDARIAEVRKQMEACAAERAQIAATVPDHLLSRYEHLRVEYPDPVVEVEDGSCGGCNLAVSGTTIDRILTELEIVTCENCSRILYMR